MSYLTLTPTNCCGFYLIQNFGQDLNEPALSPDGRTRLDKTAVEHFNEIFSDFQKQLDGRGGNRLLVANLIDSQRKWFPILEKAGFIKVARFKNANSGNFINTFAYHANTEGWPATIASLPVMSVGGYPLEKGDKLFFTDGTPVDMSTVRWNPDLRTLRVYVPDINGIEGNYHFNISDGVWNGALPEDEQYPRLMKKVETPKKALLSEYYGLRVNGARVGPFTTPAEIAEAFPRITRYQLRHIYEDGTSSYEDVRI